MQKPESVLANEMSKILWYFEIQKDHLITAKWPDRMLMNKQKRTKCLVDFYSFGGSKSENKRK